MNMQSPYPMDLEATPGPWFVADGGVCAVNCPEDGSNVICLEPEAIMAASLAKWEANAPLLAAVPDYHAVAPDALEMLNRYAAYIRTLTADELEMHPYLPELERIADDLQAALQKARGK